jgi:Tfp pilus assembly protein PilV
MVLKVDIKAFNLLEVVGAMLIIAFGITAVMGILQPSIRASRDSVGENYCADVATQILSLMETKARQKWSTVVGLPRPSRPVAPPPRPPT